MEAARRPGTATCMTWAMIVDQLRFDRATPTAAIGVQQRVRRMTVPATLGEPAPGWAAAYDKQLRRTPGARPPFKSYDAAMAVVRDALTPALPGGDAGVSLC